MIGAALGELRPVMAWRTLPLLLGGGRTIDFLPPMRSVFRRMTRAERAGEVVAASVTYCAVRDPPARRRR